MLTRLKSNKYIRKILIKILYILSYANQYTKKDDCKILFYDSGRSSLEDNAEAFYSWLKDNGYEEKYKIVICVPSEKNRNEILNYVPVGIVRGIYEYLRAKYVFFSFGDFRIRPSCDQKVINLWHGTPLKKIGKLSYDKNVSIEKTDNFNFILASSDLFVPIMAQAFGCTVDKVKVLGHARNDYLFSCNHVLEKIVLDYQKYSKCILWMPTFRQSKDDRFIDSISSNSETLLPILDVYEKLIKFDEVLQALNVLLVIKVHPYAKFKNVQLKNILMLTNEDILPKGMKLYEFVINFDALLTYYSSIYFDYMLLDRPIGFTLDDYQSYADNRGFVFENAIDFCV